MKLDGMNATSAENHEHKGITLGKVSCTISAHEYHYWSRTLLQPFRDKVVRVKKANSSGAATRRQLKKALDVFFGKWQAEELKSILNDLNANPNKKPTPP